eukprot:TRINITY_DN5350_c0_g1_i1.p1 TRINITY_DN5350_c0_g1~~TRINITY_DN5350_c0_g1_i1.p1  ORF type:complete len:483 (+),score=122.31 TRINITY_DN5350_c0_g1_i1:103-1551(+)
MRRAAVLLAAAGCSAAVTPELRVVESLPPGAGAAVKGTVATTDALVRIVELSQRTLDISAMYWDLLPVAVKGGWTEEQLDDFGASDGKRLWAAIVAATRRGVKVRVLNDGSSTPRPEGERELALLRQLEHPPEMAYWNATQWFGGGIMHMKIWVGDRSHAYLGSANMDWKSLRQVKELGILFVHNPRAAGDLGRHFDAFWAFASEATRFPTPPTRVIPPDFLGTALRFPSWDPIQPPHLRARNPLDTPATASGYSLLDQLPITANGSSGRIFFSGAPRSVLAGRRSWDLDGLLYTIRTCKKFVHLEVMDWLPRSAFGDNGSAIVWWPELQDALTQAAITRGCEVRMLIGHWAHTRSDQYFYLKAMQEQFRSCYYQPKPGPVCRGSLAIRAYEIPGWNETGDGTKSSDRWPPFTRVNHAKIIASDQRVNVGTSNFEWGYQYNDTGASFNTDHPDVLRAVYDAFMRDWESPNARPLEPPRAHGH